MEEDKRQSSINDNEPVETADNRQFYLGIWYNRFRRFRKGKQTWQENSTLYTLLRY